LPCNNAFASAAKTGGNGGSLIPIGSKSFCAKRTSIALGANHPVGVKIIFFRNTIYKRHLPKHCIANSIQDRAFREVGGSIRIHNNTTISAMPALLALVIKLHLETPLFFVLPINIY
jgi:hypothetical protein